MIMDEINKNENVEQNSSLNLNEELNEAGFNEPVKEEQELQFTQNINDPGSNSLKEKNRKPGKKRIISYILIAVLCTLLGGAASSMATIYFFTNSTAMKSSNLYKDLLEKQVNALNSDAAAKYKASPATSTGSNLTVAEIAKIVGPAVVGVSTTTTGGGAFGQGTSEGMGSGIIINDQGYVLTNYHVISGATTVKVVLNTGKEVAAKVVNYDQTSDVAIVKITDNITMPGVAALGDSSALLVGELAVAIGNPLGKEFLGSVTVGVISAVDRVIDETSSIKYIQTDAAINSGNSGGPLVNSKGEVIGINTAKITATGVEGLGFSIPINQIKSEIATLSIPMLKLGITAMDITPDIARQYNLPSGSYVYVREVGVASAAEKAGIKSGDMITKFDGQTVKTVAEINAIKAKHKAGDVVKVTLTRDNKTIELSVTLVEG
jgi:serine protease Do